MYEPHPNPSSWVCCRLLYNPSDMASEELLMDLAEKLPDLTSFPLQIEEPLLLCGPVTFRSISTIRLAFRL